MTSEKLSCPKCCSLETYRDEVDIGVGVQYGPWHCRVCGWAEPQPDYGLIDEGPEL